MSAVIGRGTAAARAVSPPRAEQHDRRPVAEESQRVEVALAAPSPSARTWRRSGSPRRSPRPAPCRRRPGRHALAAPDRRRHRLERGAQAVVVQDDDHVAPRDGPGERHHAGGGGADGLLGGGREVDAPVPRQPVVLRRVERRQHAQPVEAPVERGNPPGRRGSLRGVGVAAPATGAPSTTTAPSTRAAPRSRARRETARPRGRSAGRTARRADGQADGRRADGRRARCEVTAPACRSHADGRGRGGLGCGRAARATARDGGCGRPCRRVDLPLRPARSPCPARGTTSAEDGAGRLRASRPRPRLPVRPGRGGAASGVGPARTAHGASQASARVAPGVRPPGSSPTTAPRSVPRGGAARSVRAPGGSRAARRKDVSWPS